MRLGWLITLVFFTALALALWREPVGRVFVIVFGAGLAEAYLGTLALMALFQTLSTMVSATESADQVEAFATSGLILLGAATSMSILAVLAAALAWRVAA